MVTTVEEVAAWFAGRVEDHWFSSAPRVRVDREEVLVVGELAEPKVEGEAGEDARLAACSARIDGFREDTRDRRVRIAGEAEHRWERKVSWGARCGEVERHFTVASVPVMTRLRMDERSVLDTLIDAGVARSRSEALAWCVRMVGQHEGDWIEELREALATVADVRRRGPGS